MERDGKKDNEVTCIPSGAVIGQDAPFCAYLVGDLGSFALQPVCLDCCKPAEDLMGYSRLNISDVIFFSLAKLF